MIDIEPTCGPQSRRSDVAERCAGGRVVSLLEGGYDLQGLANSVAAHVTALMRG